MLTLGSDTVCIFLARTGRINDPELLAAYRSVLSPEEIRKVDRYRFEKDRKLSLVARALLRYLLSEYTGRDPASFAFVTNAYGKPALAPGQPVPDLRFNLSHSSGAVACGLALGRDIGVDVESPDRKIDTGISDRFFSPHEAGQVSSCPESERHRRFFDIWTLKEAYIKARGKGLSIPLDSFSFDLDRPEISIRFHGEPGSDEAEDSDSSGWRFFRWRPDAGLTLAACVQSRGDIMFRAFDCVPFQALGPGSG
ncbi:MAG: 4'-phosphopantetheinyl transferase superfamily protein [Desulfobacter sp.]